MVQVDELGPGEIGFITASIKEVADTRVGDTITEERRPCENALPGFKPAQPVVFCGLFQLMQPILMICVQPWANYA